MNLNDSLRLHADGIATHMGLCYEECNFSLHGDIFLELECESGEIQRFEFRNVVTKDAGILLARLVKNPSEPAHGINMLAVGSGGSGNPLTPNAATNVQRKLNSEIARKAFSSIQFRTAAGAAVAYPTNIVDFTVTFGFGEAAGAWNEMGLLSTVSNNPQTLNTPNVVYPTYDAALDLTSKDMLCNYHTFGVITKPSQSKMTIKWRLTF